MIVEKEEESIIIPKILANRGIVQFFKHWSIKFGHDFFSFRVFFLSKDILELVVHKNTNYQRFGGQGLSL